LGDVLVSNIGPTVVKESRGFACGQCRNICEQQGGPNRCRAWIVGAAVGPSALIVLA